MKIMSTKVFSRNFNFLNKFEGRWKMSSRIFNIVTNYVKYAIRMKELYLNMY